MKICLPFFALAALLLGPPPQAQAQKTATHELPITPATAAWGYYDAAAPPVLRIKSGETVRVHTLITSTPARLEGAGLPAAQVEPTLRDITEHVSN